MNCSLRGSFVCCYPQVMDRICSYYFFVMMSKSTSKECG